MMDHELDRLPKFLRLLIFSYSGFSQKSSTYNTLVAMAATAVCNEYVMARLLRPEKIRGKYMTASAPQPPYL